MKVSDSYVGFGSEKAGGLLTFWQNGRLSGYLSSGRCTCSGNTGKSTAQSVEGGRTGNMILVYLEQITGHLRDPGFPLTRVVTQPTTMMNKEPLKWN